MEIDGRGSGNCLQLRLLLWKNFLLKKRNLANTISEIFLPVAGCLILVAIRSVVYPEYVKEDLNLEHNVTCLPGLGADPASLGLFISAIACGARNSQGTLSTAAVTFAVAANNNLTYERDQLASVLRKTITSFALQEPFIPCSTKPLACYIPVNEDLPQCQNAKTVNVSLLERVSRPNFVRTFDSIDAMIEYVNSAKYATSDDINPPIYFGISIKSGAPNWDYAIHGNFSSLPITRNIYERFLIGYSDSRWKQYITQGFTIMQYFVDNWILNGGLYTTSITFIPFPVAKYKTDQFSSSVAQVFGLFLIMCLMWPFSRLVRNIVEEKERRIKEGMKMMGLHSFAFWFSWIISYMVIFVCIALLSAGLFSFGVFQYSSFSIIFLIFLLFGLSLITMGCFVSSIFSRAKSAGTLSPFALFALWLPYFSVTSDGTPKMSLGLSCLASPVAFTLATSRALQYESTFTGVTWTNINEDIDNFNIEMALQLMLLDIFLYGSLAWYFDKVVQGDYGTSLPFYFCCLPQYWCPTDKQEPSENKQQLLDDVTIEDDSSIQSVPQSLKDKPGINVVKLRKVFGKNVAVEQLNLNMYEGQIFVLLGHNGAGKTTTINMLTGMMPSSDGTAYLYGCDINIKMNSIRKFLGVCPQHDILFPSLTVKEHLELFAYLKGVHKNNVLAEVEQSIHEIQLEMATNQMAGSLSGGQKRRLSLAISLIGDSKVVFLDEPTSGVDPASRRAIWDLLNIKKAGRTIILTTHFMDEADILGDRIAILHKGKLRCCGTSLFLKKIFGVGYNITMTKESAKTSSQALKNLIRQSVPDAAPLSDSGTELSMQLPFTASSQFPMMLQELESRKKELGCLNFGLSVTTMEEVFLRVANEIENPSEYQKDRASIRKLSSVHRMRSDDLNLLESQRKQSVALGHFKALLSKRWAVAKRDRKAQCCQFLVPLLILFFGLFLINSPPKFEPPSLTLAPNMFTQPVPTPYNEFFMGIGTNLKTKLSSRGIELFPFRTTEKIPQDFTNIVNFSQKLLDSRLDIPQSMYGAFFQQDTPQSKLLNINILTNITGRHAIPTFFNTLTNGLYQRQNLLENRSITVSSSPFPFTQSEQETFTSALGVFTAIIIALAFSFIPSAYVVFIVKEREIKAKHIQIISGVQIEAYWLSNYFFDYVSFCIPGVIGAAVIYAFGQEAFVGGNFIVLLLSILLYGAAVIPFTYLCSFFFKSASTAQNVMILIYIFGGVILLLVSFIFYTIDSTKPYADTFRFFFRIIPNFCLGDTVFYLSILQLLSVLSFDVGNRWDLTISGWDFIFLAIEAVGYFCAVLILEHLLQNNMISLDCSRVNPHLMNKGLDKVEDSDVREEKQRIINGQYKDHLISLHGLRKVYPQKVAVNDLWFTVPAGQCFGFLGVNGAGKTTTLKMITGDETPTQGDAFIYGTSAIQHPEQVRRMIGYCPQFDALHSLMTAEETLTLYARIRNIPEKNIPKMVRYLCSRLTLDQNDQHKRPAGTYSGGNKRKLSVAIALIGGPKCVFLDEPSTGMDPVSRRFMWDFISETMAGCAVILTTHSMEECEALCARISILVHGRLRCIGSSQHLKDRFGTGFEFVLSVQEGNTEKVRKWIGTTFTNSSEMECYGGNMKYKLGRQSMELSQIFNVIENNKKNLGIVDYSVGQTTLEQIFIHFAREGDKELDAELTGQEYKKPSYGLEEKKYDRI